MTPQALGWRLARARRRAGLSQGEVARRMGTTQSAVSRLEAGRITSSLDIVNRFSQALGEPITLTFGASDDVIERSTRSKRARAALRDFRFDPWDRDPTEAEARTLRADQIERDD